VSDLDNSYKHLYAGGYKIESLSPPVIHNEIVNVASIVVNETREDPKGFMCSV
jgi:hypothetical protein